MYVYEQKIAMIFLEIQSIDDQCPFRSLAQYLLFNSRKSKEKKEICSEAKPDFP
ncbi:MAG: hypothetical protein K8S23_05095 [Candidatus Cloacimonetes bacterium]|nr:hypothetical protein [Candidatus Cloacimonadota bacterium]